MHLTNSGDFGITFDDGTRIELYSGERGETFEASCTVGEFCADNADDAEACEAVRALGVGEETAIGGGASPLFVVRREA